MSYKRLFLSLTFTVILAAGCASTVKVPKIDYQAQSAVLQERLNAQEAEISALNEKNRQLQEQLNQLDRESKQKDTKIDYLKNKLKSFGVFE